MLHWGINSALANLHVQKSTLHSSHSIGSLLNFWSLRRQQLSSTTVQQQRGWNSHHVGTLKGVHTSIAFQSDSLGTLIKKSLPARLVTVRRKFFDVSVKLRRSEERLLQMLSVNKDTGLVISIAPRIRRSLNWAGVPGSNFTKYLDIDSWWLLSRRFHSWTNDFPSHQLVDKNLRRVAVSKTASVHSRMKAVLARALSRLVCKYWCRKGDQKFAPSR